MSRMAVFYHAQINGGHRPIDPSFGIKVMTEQMDAMEMSGLIGEVDEFYVGSNGTYQDTVPARILSPLKCTFLQHPPDSCADMETMRYMRNWVSSHDNWKVMYIHCKGVSHPRCELNRVWRECMMTIVVHNWRQCVKDLDSGYDSVGGHWLSPEVFGPQVPTPFWGGNFWWSNASFLLKLPGFPNNPTWEDRFYCERWIGLGTRPRVKDYAPHWPGLNECSVLANA